MTSSKRRGNNEGSVYQEGARRPSGPTGRWIAQVLIDGKKRRAIADSEAKAKKRLREMLGQLDSGRLVVDGNLTVRQLLELWMTKAVPNRNLQQPTIEVHKWACAILVEDIGGKRVKSLTPDHVEAAFEKRAAQGLSRSSLIKLRSTLGQALGWAERRGLATRNVARLVELPHTATPPAHGRSMTSEEARTFLTAAQGTWLEAMWILMLYLGVRPGEAAALSWYDVDFGEGVVHVRRGRKRIKGRVQVGTTKNPGSVRSLEAPPQVMAALRRRQQSQRAERLAAGERWHNDEHLVFSNAVGSMTDPPKVRAEFNHVIAEADLGHGWTPKLLRHSAASLMSDAGVPLERIADQLGHKDTRMLSAHYRHRVRPTIDGNAVMVDVLNAR